jgi:hephaestin
MGMTIADMVPDNPGKWLFHCHVHYHMRLGMQAFYTVEPATPGDKQRQFSDHKKSPHPTRVKGEKHAH